LFIPNRDAAVLGAELDELDELDVGVLAAVREFSMLL
jgi:hypothetical protein